MDFFSLVTLLAQYIPYRVFKPFKLSNTDPNTFYMQVEDFLNPPTETLDSAYCVFFLLSAVYNNALRIAGFTPPIDFPSVEEGVLCDTEFVKVLSQLFSLGSLTYTNVTDFRLDISRFDLDKFSLEKEFILDKSLFDTDRFDDRPENQQLSFSLTTQMRCILAKTYSFFGAASKSIIRDSLTVLFNADPLTFRWEENVAKAEIKVSFSSDLPASEIGGLLDYRTPTGVALYVTPLYGTLSVVAESTYTPPPPP